MNINSNYNKPYEEMTLERCVISCFNNEHFVNEFNKMSKTDLKASGDFFSLLEEATGKKAEILRDFIKVVETTVYSRLFVKN